MDDTAVGRLAGRVAIVTGAGNGIGRGVAERFARDGARVVVATRSEGPGRETVDAITAAGGSAVLDVVDVGDRSEVTAMVKRTVERFDAIDIVLHNASAMDGAPLGEVEDELLDRMFDLSTKCCFWLLRDTLPWLRKSRAGRVLVTSSAGGNRVVAPTRVPYGAAKTAVTGFVRGAALELAPDGITVNAVEPGFVLSHIVRTRMPPEGQAAMTASVPIGRAGLPEDIASLFAFLASDEASYITGQSIVVDGGLSLQTSYGAQLSPKR